jgi:hypothetical protein
MKLKKTKQFLGGDVLSIAKKKEMIVTQIIRVWWIGMISIRLNHG